MFLALPWFLFKAVFKKLRIKLRHKPLKPLIQVGEGDLDDGVKAVAAYIKSRKCGSICLMVSMSLVDPNRASGVVCSI